MIPPNTPGVFHGVPAETYFAAPGVSHSMLCNMSPPAKLPAYLAQKREPTVAMMIGTLTHHKLLTPNDPLPAIAIKPEGMKFSNTEGKEWRAANTGKLIVKESDWLLHERLAESITENEDRKAIFAEGSPEVAVFAASDVHDGILRKCRIDWVPKHGNALVCIKTCRDASPDGFSKALWDESYFTQAPWYLDTWNAATGEDRKAFVFVCVEKEPPYLVACYELERKDINRGRDINAARLDTYARCVKAGYWPGYWPGINPIGLPAWTDAKAVA